MNPNADVKKRPTREEARKEWITALRSGKYKQTKEYLAARGGYCCLGVACHIFADRLGLLRIEHQRLCADSEETINFDYHVRTLPDPVIELLGLYSAGGDDRRCVVGNSLAQLNDDRNYTFAMIADALETGNYWKD